MMFRRITKGTMTISKKRRIILTTLLLWLLIATAWMYWETLITAWHKCLVNIRLRRWSGREEESKNYVDKKKILFWNTMFGDEWFYMGDKKHFDDCPIYNNCYVTNWRWTINVGDFDAVLFHVNELTEYDLPEERNPGQIYVYANLESPANRLTIADDNDLFQYNYFNATMTYRLDSDVPWPYRIIQNVDGDGKAVAPSESVKWREPSLDLLRRKLDVKVDKKKKLAAWFVSNCDTKGRRELLVKELSEHIQIDIVGKCAGRRAPYCPITKDCFAELVEPDYFFYLSFENALCDDYVTEKFYNPLR